MIKQKKQTKSIALFEACPDSVAVQAGYRGKGLIFNWSRKGIGFGQLRIFMKDGQFYVDNECMSPEFCADVIKQAIQESLDKEKK